MDVLLSQSLMTNEMIKNRFYLHTIIVSQFMYSILMPIDVFIYSHVRAIEKIFI